MALKVISFTILEGLNKMICDDCKQDKPDTVKTICPFDECVRDKDTECVLCKQCYQERCDEI